MVDKKTELFIDKEPTLINLNCRINTRYNRVVPLGMHFEKPSMTQQQFESECNLNNIVDRNMRFKDPSFVTKLQLMHSTSESREPIYGDFTGVTDYASALNAIDNARSDFMSLPSKVREYFDNDPAKLLSFIDDSNNYEKGVELGLFKKVDKQDELRNSLDLSFSQQQVQNPAPEGVSSVSETSAQ